LPARTAAEAVEEYRTSAARALSCVTGAHVDVGGGYAPSDIPHALVVAGGDPVALRGDSRLTLSVGEQYGVVDEGDNGWRVRISAYFYGIGQQRGAELITYHWHPQGRGMSAGPHLHVNADVRSGPAGSGRSIFRRDPSRCKT